ncbi:MAG TPA: hypothetical protein VN959_15900, partial [Mycobacterium sp.]|nr:hypothetical protein [Mycobacterium sp.]
DLALRPHRRKMGCQHPTRTAIKENQKWLSIDPDPVAWMICLLLWSPLKAQKSKTSSPVSGSSA